MKCFIIIFECEWFIGFDYNIVGVLFFVCFEEFQITACKLWKKQISALYYLWVFFVSLCNSQDYKYNDYNYDQYSEYNNQKPEDYTDDYSQQLNDYYNQNLLAPSIPPPPQPPMGKITFFLFQIR